MEPSTKSSQADTASVPLTHSPPTVSSEPKRHQHDQVPLGQENDNPSSTVLSTDSSLNANNSTAPTSTSESSTLSSSVKPHLHRHHHYHRQNQIQQQDPQVDRTTSFPLVSGSQSRLFTLLPNPETPAYSSLSPQLQSHQAVNSSESQNDSTPVSRSVTTGTDETSANYSAHARELENDDDDSKPLRTLRYNWTDYEDRLLLRIVLSNHRTIYDLRYKPLKRFWELAADRIKQFSINTRVSRTHRQCRERFYVLYGKLVKFAEQLGIDPSQLDRRSSQGLNFTELEELYLKILQVLKLEDGFKLLVNEDFYKDPKLVEEFDKSVALKNDKQTDETTLSLASTKSSDKEVDEKVITNVSSTNHKITPFTSLNLNLSNRPYSFSTGSFSHLRTMPLQILRIESI